MVGTLIGLFLLGGAWYYYTRVAYTPIGDLKANPRAYEGKSITIEGEVTGRTSLILIKGYTLKDRTGEIQVVTKRVLPEAGSRVRIQGKIEESFKFGALQMLVFVEEDIAR
jgi:hypothetical protein